MFQNGARYPNFDEIEYSGSILRNFVKILKMHDKIGSTNCIKIKEKNTFYNFIKFTYFTRGFTCRTATQAGGTTEHLDFWQNLSVC